MARDKIGSGPCPAFARPGFWVTQVIAPDDDRDPALPQRCTLCPWAVPRPSHIPVQEVAAPELGSQSPTAACAALQDSALCNAGVNAQSGWH